MYNFKIDLSTLHAQEMIDGKFEDGERIEAPQMSNGPIGNPKKERSKRSFISNLMDSYFKEIVKQGNGVDKPVSQEPSINGSSADTSFVEDSTFSSVYDQCYCDDEETSDDEDMMEPGGEQNYAAHAGEAEFGGHGGAVLSYGGGQSFAVPGRVAMAGVRGEHRGGSTFRGGRGGGGDIGRVEKR